MGGGMALPRAPLLLSAAVLGSFVPGAFCGPPTHSLCYFYVHLPEPSQGLRQSFIRGNLDDQPIARFDSLTGKMEPLVPWMKQVEKETFRDLEWVFGAEMEKLSELSHLTRGLHTWQLVLGCELREDGSKGGFLRYGYDGMDFISFDKKTLRWVAAQPQAKKVKEKWEDDPRRSQRNKAFLEETCIEWLQRYLSYQKEAPQRIEPPVGKVTLKVVDDNQEVVTCQAFGFYPKEIQATWTRDGEVWKNKTLRRNVAPNSDGTYYVRLSIEIDPKERHNFQCHLEHEGLQEPLVLALKEETAGTLWIPLRIVAALILVVWNLFLIWCWIKRRKVFYQKVKSSFGDVPSKVISSSPTCGTDNEIQLKSMLHSQRASDDRASYGGRSSQRALEDSGSSLRRQEGKQQTLRRSKSCSGELEVLDKAGARESEEMEQE